ncbi:hypothetical protein AWC38_SpisGene16535 [Stylophora pistillata]|uniref:Endonuclease/exonuclease/phosphatase domain-containing protein n=1 Tax=Stylophora pistillata TaxID=50429 RepID=A0A2B4RRB2_STYPI|nr:hypothetical protein AWC38_SpisGene16535 [Stylophora pistillata]
MDDGRAKIAVSIGLILLLLIWVPDSCYRLLGETADPDKLSHEKMLLNVNWDNTGDHCLAPIPFYRRHLGLVFNTRGGFHHCRISRYSNSDSTFQLIRLAIGGDIQLNPGPSTLESSIKKPFCQELEAGSRKDIRVAHLNVCSIRNKIDELRREDWNGNSAKLRSIFEMFNMENVIRTATRITLTSRTLIDLIVTTRKDSFGITGAFPLGISDHNLTYANLRLKNKRPSPKFITTRNYRRWDEERSRNDIETAPRHMASVFNDEDDRYLVGLAAFI